MTLDEAAFLAERMEWWRIHPADFIREALGAEPTPHQLELLDYFEERLEGDPRAIIRAAIRSGHGTGKSCVMSWLLIWFVSLHNNARALVTSPAADQLHAVLWPELHKWHEKMPPLLRDTIEITNDQIRQVAAPQSAFAVCRTAPKDRTEGLQGLHDEHVLIVVDETSGVPDPVCEALEGSMSTPGAITVFISNPTQTSGRFYEIFHNPRYFALWKRLHWNGETSPYQTQEYRDGIIAACGGDKTHDRYQIRVLGNFPKAGARKFIAPASVSDAKQRVYRDSQIAHSARVGGLDVARFGDNISVLAIRQGLRAEKLIAFPQGLDTMTLASKAALYYQGQNLDALLVDGCGVGGGVVDRLRQMGGMRVFDVQSGGKPADDAKYVNVRAEMYDRVREWLLDGGALEFSDELLDAQLTDLEYRYTIAGDKLQIETKDEMRKRGVDSPDRADAFALTFAVPVRRPGLAGSTKTHQRTCPVTGRKMTVHGASPKPAYDPLGL